ncbi:MAG: hypothetical protein CBC10_001580 [Gammaproteobacteria bacterium TMED50]|nr:MAG: hypothetical protein CBC10_001580 [Gammaproteobacteria bacterium TMED50]
MTEEQSRIRGIWWQLWRPRPVWMSGVMLFCFYMTFIYMPFDMFLKPVEQDEEVWFGIVLHGWYAKATEPLHWVIYAAGAWGFYHMRGWMTPWAALYTLQVAIAMLVFSGIDPRGAGWLWGLLLASVFCGLAAALWFSRAHFGEHD